MDIIARFHNYWNGVDKEKASLRKGEDAVRIGVLGAANINYPAIIDPIQTHPGAILAGIAARQLSRAQAQISQYKIDASCKAYGSYQELLADPDIQAVYIPTPNGLHAEHAIMAMEAGKHVLIEKPITSNANEARKVREVATRTNRVALEAFHWRCHPAAHTVKALVESGKYGSPTEISTRLKVPAGLIAANDIRLQYDLAGGACMDLTYVFSSSCYLGSPDITKCRFDVLKAVPRFNKVDKRVDDAMKTTFTISQPGKPEVTCNTDCDFSMPPLFGFIPRIWELSPVAIIELEKARIEFSNYVLPYLGHSITVTEKDHAGRLTTKKHTQNAYTDGPFWRSRGRPYWSTYRYQLEAFVEMVKAKDAGREVDVPYMTLPESEKLMELIDSVYDKAGMSQRGV